MITRNSSVKFVILLSFFCTQVSSFCDNLPSDYDCGCEEKVQNHYYHLYCPREESEAGVEITIEREKISVSCDVEKDFLDWLPENLNNRTTDDFKITKIVIGGCFFPVQRMLSDYSKRLGIKEVTELHLKSYFNQDVHADFFGGFENTTKLELINLRLPHITILNNLTSLSSLSLINNNLTTIEGLIMNNLQSLRVEKNKLKVISKNDFATLKALREIQILDSGTETIEDDALVNQGNLAKFKFRSKFLITISPNIFNNKPYLQDVQLINNERNTTSIPQNLFSNATSLSSLTIQCGLTAITGDIFKNLLKLEKLVLSRNNIDQLPENLFASLTELNFLNLADNQLTALGNNVFEKNLKLKHVDFSGNKFTIVSEAIFQNHNSLEIINFNDNQLTSFNYDALSQVYLQEIRLRNNQLSFKNLTGCPIRNLQAGIKVRLTLQNNKISSLSDVKCLLNHTNLHRLDLSHNAITKVFLTDFNMPEIVRNTKLLLDLQQNDITYVQFFDTVDSITINADDDDNLNKIQVNLNNNPLICMDCVTLDNLIDRKLINSRKVIQYMGQSLSFAVTNFTCIDTMFCEIQTKRNGHRTCPRFCSCRVQSSTRTARIDCNSRNLTDTPEIPKYDDDEVLSIKLDISNNMISKLYFNFRSGSLHKLKQLVAENNKINEINFNAFPNQITEINLNNNKMTAMDEATFKLLNQRGDNLVVNLKNNPWSCHSSGVEFDKLKFESKFNIFEPKQVGCLDEHRGVAHKVVLFVLLFVSLGVVLGVAGYIGYTRYSRRRHNPIRYANGRAEVELNENLISDF